MNDWESRAAQAQFLELESQTVTHYDLLCQTCFAVLVSDSGETRYEFAVRAHARGWRYHHNPGVVLCPGCAQGETQ